MPLPNQKCCVGVGTFEGSDGFAASFSLSKGTTGAPKAHVGMTFDPRAAPHYRDSTVGAVVMLAPETTTIDASAAASQNYAGRRRGMVFPR